MKLKGFIIAAGVVPVALLRIHDVAAIPMFKAIRTAVSTNHHGTDEDLTVDELIKHDVAELCKIVRRKETLIKLFNSGKPLISKIFQPISRANDRSDITNEENEPNMCFGVHVAMRNNWHDIVDKYYRHPLCRLFFKGKDRITMALYGSHKSYIISNEQFFKTMFSIRTNGLSLYQKFMDHAARNGELEILQSTDLKTVDGSLDAMNWAAFNGHLDVVKWLHVDRRMRNYNFEKTGCSKYAIVFAAEQDHVEVVKYLFENCREKSDLKEALSMVRCKNHELTLNFLLSVLNTVDSISTEGK
jgi:hypothetical protein